MWRKNVPKGVTLPPLKTSRRHFVQCARQRGCTSFDEMINFGNACSVLSPLMLALILHKIWEHVSSFGAEKIWQIKLVLRVCWRENIWSGHLDVRRPSWWQLKHVASVKSRPVQNADEPYFFVMASYKVHNLSVTSPSSSTLKWARCWTDSCWLVGGEGLCRGSCWCVGREGLYKDLLGLACGKLLTWDTYELCRFITQNTCITWNLCLWEYVLFHCVTMSTKESTVTVCCCAELAVTFWMLQIPCTIESIFCWLVSASGQRARILSSAKAHWCTVSVLSCTDPVMEACHRISVNSSLNCLENTNFQVFQVGKTWPHTCHFSQLVYSYSKNFSVTPGC